MDLIKLDIRCYIQSLSVFASSLSMSERTDLKRKIFAFVDQLDETVVASEEEKDQLRALCDEISQYTPCPEPINNQHVSEGVWLTRFASFGAKHSDSQPLQHDTSLMFLSFGNLPKAAIRVTSLHQEIEESSAAYNNVVFIENPSGDAKAVVVMDGVYSGDEDNLQRYSVAFTGVRLVSVDGSDEAALRQAFGIDADAPLSKEFRPPKLHSDIVYVDEDMRINYGGLGGFYVLQRLTSKGFSVPLNSKQAVTS